MIFICFLLCIIASYLLIEQNLAIGNVVLKGVLAFYVTTSVLSLCFAAFLFAEMNFMIFEVVFLLVPLIYLLVEIKKRKGLHFNYTNLTNTSFTVLLILLLSLSLFSYHFFTASVRWGDWDAWAIWSQHAKFLTDADAFDQLFTNQIAWTHPDYPLMLPSIIAMFWKSMGTYSPFVPAVFSYIIAVSLVLMILASFLEKQMSLLGIAIFLILTYSLVLFPYVTSQCADTLLASFILIPFVLLAHLPKSKQWLFLFLIGFFAAACGWIKNEGLMFFCIFSAYFFIKYFRQRDFIKYFVFGAAFPLLILMIFKLSYAPSNDLVNGSQDYLTKITDFGRYKLIFDYQYAYLSDNCQLLYYAMLAILLIHYKYYFSFGFLVILTLFTSYFFAYVISPNDLIWHLSTSFDRLVHQVFPVSMYMIFCTAGLKFSNPNLLKSFQAKVLRNQPRTS